ncbi:MAG: DNA polymerase III subunit beta, partial [Nitrospirae bacterium]
LQVIEVQEPGSLCLPAKKFYEAVREMEGELVIQSEGSEWVKIKSGKTSFRLACMSPDEFPRWPETKDALEFEMEPALLQDMITKTIFSAGEQETRYTLNSVLFHLKPPSELRLVSTDGHRLAAIKTNIGISVDTEIKAIVPKKAASELKSLLQKADSSVKIKVASNHMAFYIDSIVFLVMLIEGSYPNYEDVIPTENDRVLIADRESLIKVLKRVSIVSRERQNAVKFTLSSGLLHLSASSPEVGEAEDEIEVEYSADDFAIGFNAKYLIEAMSVMEEEKVSIKMKEPLSATVVEPVGNENYLAVVMPLRL